MILVSPLASEIELETRESGDPLKIEWDYLEKGIVRDACSQACPVLSCLLLSSLRDSLLVFSPPPLSSVAAGRMGQTCWKKTRLQEQDEKRAG